MSPTMLKDKEKYAQTRAPEPEPDVTVYDDVDHSIFSQPSHDEVAVLAYSFWIADGRQDGSADEHWMRAERELRSRRSAGSSGSGMADSGAAAPDTAASGAAKSSPARSASRTETTASRAAASDSSRK